MLKEDGRPYEKGIITNSSEFLFFLKLREKEFILTKERAEIYNKPEINLEVRCYFLTPDRAFPDEVKDEEGKLIYKLKN